MTLTCFFASNLARGTNQPLSLSITVPQQVVQIGSEVKIKTTLTNITNHVITLHDRIPACDYPVEVLDESGNPAPETDYQRSLNCNARLTESRNILVTLGSQESRQDEIILNQLFKLNSPGNYSVQVSRRIPKELSPEAIKSNIVTITLTK
jgi:hypothetical protein